MGNYADWLNGREILLVPSDEQSADCGTWISEAGGDLTALSIQAARYYCTHAPKASFDAAIVDVGDGADDAFAVADDLARIQPGCALLILANRPTAEVVTRIRQLGASLLAKPLTQAEFIFAVATAGGTAMPDLRTLTAKATRRWLLSRQQARLLYYNLWSYSNQEIAEALGVSLHTVQDYQRDLRRKTGARTKDGYLRRLLECAGVSPPLQLDGAGALGVSVEQSLSASD